MIEEDFVLTNVRFERGDKVIELVGSYKCHPDCGSWVDHFEEEDFIEALRKLFLNNPDIREKVLSTPVDKKQKGDKYDVIPCKEG